VPKNPVTDTTPEIIYIRHGETDWNARGLIQGSIETDLNAKGHEQARAVAALLAQRNLKLSEYDFFVSPQKRARQTMAHIVVALSLPSEYVVMDRRLRELEFGVWESKPFWELKASPLYPADAETRYFWRPEGGESYEDGVTRVRDFQKRLTRKSIIVSHGAIGRSLIGEITKLSPSEIVMLKTPQGACCGLSNGVATWFDGSPLPA
jgi:broad specificity phosphatase PhoE